MAKIIFQLFLVVNLLEIKGFISNFYSLIFEIINIHCHVELVFSLCPQHRWMQSLEHDNLRKQNVSALK